MYIITNILIIVGCLALALLAIRHIVGWQVGRAKKSILNELRYSQADSPERAVPLDYYKPIWQRIGVRDYRPFVLTALVQKGEIGKTREGKYYIARTENRL